MAVVWRTRCVFSVFSHIKSSNFINPTVNSHLHKFGAHFEATTGHLRLYSSYRSSPNVDSFKENYEYEIVKKPPEWEYVERLLPLKTIPKLIIKDNYPSGFVPPREEGLKHSFFIPRTKNHHLPIYLQHVARGAGKRILIKRIEGDIWALNDEIKALLKNQYGKHIETSVNEMCCSILVKGDYLIDLVNWAHSKGF